MKFKLLIFSALLFALHLQGQEVIALRLQTNHTETDTTYRFCEMTIMDGDTVGYRYYPKTWLDKASFQRFAFQMANNEIERRQEFDRLAEIVQQNIDFFAARIDQVCGTGTYAAMQHNSLKAKMQGPWSLIIRQDGQEPDVSTVVITESTMTGMNKTASITWTNGERFRLNGSAGGFFLFNLTFEQEDPMRFIAVRDGITYVLKR